MPQGQDEVVESARTTECQDGVAQRHCSEPGGVKVTQGVWVGTVYVAMAWTMLRVKSGTMAAVVSPVSLGQDVQGTTSG